MNKKAELVKLLKLRNNTPIDKIIEHIACTSIQDPVLQNKITQHLRNMPAAKQLLESLKITKFKTFKIIISEAFSNGRTLEGGISIYLNNKKIAYSHAKYIYLKNLTEWKTENHINKDILHPHSTDAVFATGCGCIGCCPGLFWDILHKDGRILIKNIFYDGGGYEPEKHIEKISGEYIIDKKDYISEIDKVNELFQKAASRTGPWKHPSKKWRKRCEPKIEIPQATPPKIEKKPGFWKSLFNRFKK